MPLPRKAPSLTRRVVWAVTSTVAVLLGLLAVLAYVTMHVQEDELTDAMLNREAQQLIAMTIKPGLMPVGPLHAGPNLTAWLTREALGEDELPPILRHRAPGLYQVEPDGAVWHVAVIDTDDGRLTVVVDATSFEERVYRYGWTLLALWTICVAVAVAVARGVAAIAVAPILEATRAITAISPDGPADVRPRSDEASMLIEAFNRFRDRADENVAREREFAANLNHEIRTPLTTIRTDAELIALDGATTAQQERLARIVASVDDIVATAESTLSSSAEHLTRRETVNLRDCVLGVRDALSHRAGARGLQVEIDMAADETLTADRQALLTVLRNIVRNAVDHAAPATLRVTGDRHVLRFTDDGPGVEAAALPWIFERFHQGHRRDDATEEGNPRRGLGLAIVRRLCDLQGWQVSARSPVAGGRGTAFEIRFIDASPEGLAAQQSALTP